MGRCGVVKNRVLNNFQLSEHFKLYEFECPHCEAVKVTPQLIEVLERFRELTGNEPCVITSGYRCYYQNRKVGGARESRHLYGDAVDIRIWRYLERMTFEELARLALEAGFTYVAMEDDHLHADVRPLLPGQKPKIDDLRRKGVYE